MLEKFFFFHFILIVLVCLQFHYKYGSQFNESDHQTIWKQHPTATAALVNFYFYFFEIKFH